MSPTADAIRAAVAAFLAGETFAPLAVDEVRDVYVPAVDAAALRGRVVLSVVLAESVYTPLTRAADQAEHAIDVGIQAEATDQARIAALRALVAQVRERLHRRRMAGASYRSIAEVPYDAAMLRGSGVFTALLTPRYAA